MNEFQTGTEAIAFGVGQLRGAAGQIVRQYIAQGASADGLAEPARARQFPAVIGTHTDTSSLSDEVKYSHKNEALESVKSIRESYRRGRCAVTRSGGQAKLGENSQKRPGVFKPGRCVILYL